MTYAPHRSDLISFEIVRGSALVLHRVISGLDWQRRVGLEEYLTPMEAAVALQVHRVTVYDWIAKGVIPAYEGQDGQTWLLWREVYDFGSQTGRIP